MIELAQHIEALLLENDCVIIPNFGGFVAHYSPATRVEEENLFLPPMRTIGFNPQLKLNDGVLVQSYMTVHDTNFSDATRLIENQVNELIAQLHKEGKISLENIGEVRYNIHGVYEFSPCEFKITSPYFYGLDSFEMKELSTLLRREKVLVPTVFTEEKKTYDIRINRAFLRNAVAMIAAIVLFFSFSTPIENTYIGHANYAQLLPSEWFDQLGKQSVAMSVIPTKTQQAVKTNNKPTKQIPAAQTSRPIAVREIKVSKPIEAPVATTPAVNTPTANNHPFHIIIAGGISKKVAESVASQMKEKGFTDAQVLNTDGKIRVSILSFSNREEATKRMLELRKNEAYQDVWLLAK